VRGGVQAGDAALRPPSEPGLRLPAEGVVVSADLPVAVAVRRPSRRIPNRPMWVVPHCPYCKRPHAHPADPAMTAMTVGAPCSRERFYRLQEVADQ
jgi:hypothetical protein